MFGQLDEGMHPSWTSGCSSFLGSNTKAAPPDLVLLFVRARVMSLLQAAEDPGLEPPTTTTRQLKVHDSSPHDNMMFVSCPASLFRAVKRGCSGARARLEQQAAEVLEGGVLPVVAHGAPHAQQRPELRRLARVAGHAVDPPAHNKQFVVT